ncbi:MAG TPA: cyanophycin synthetase [Solirubrobacterales bacterium]|nr:cyanophycin synthetase [Solirubrobacterales bacterium]
MRFGLDRIRKLVSVLGMPQHRFVSLHVVGTNGKSSVTEMIAALLEAHGVSSGAYLSPHDERWSQRIQVRGAELAPAAFAAAVERVAQAIEVVDRSLDPDDSVTQFEADTAAAFVAIAAAGVEAGVIEAGLGGRLDATNVLPSRVTVLTSIGLEHTEWLGETETEIAAEKLAVLRDHTRLVIGPVPEAVEELARMKATERHSEIVTVRDLAPQVELASPAPYLRRNFAVALAAAEGVLGTLDVEAVAGVAAGLDLHGRMETIAGDPPLLLDAAHNPAGAEALAEALAAVAAGQPLVGCLAVLADKDAAGILAALAPRLDGLVATEVPAERLASAGRPGARALEADALAGAAREAGVGGVEAVADPVAAVARARTRATELGGIVLVTGSHYLLRYATE